MYVCIWELGLGKNGARSGASGKRREVGRGDRVTVLFVPFQLKSIYYVLSKFIIFLPSHIVCILQIRHNFQMSIGEEAMAEAGGGVLQSHLIMEEWVTYRNI